ncbi:MAG: hypothetical protein ACKD6N_00020 [Candidatus Bathyarchaeota archaeon]
MKAVGVRFFRDKGGTGTVVGTVMAIMIIMLIIGGVFLWSSTVTHYMSNFDRERLSENAAVSATWKYRDEEGYIVTVRVRNTGTIDLSLASLWLIEVSSGGQEQHAMVEFNPYIPVGEAVNINSTYIQQLSNSVGGINPLSSTYKFKIVTSRGNIFEAKLVPFYAEGETNPVSISPDPSETRVELEVKVTRVQVTAWNTLEDKDITISYVAVTPMYNETTLKHGDLVAKQEPLSMLVETNWTLPPGGIDTKIFEIDTEVVFNLWSYANYFRIELVSDAYKIVGVVFIPAKYDTQTKVYNFDGIGKPSNTHIALYDNGDTNIDESVDEINWVNNPAEFDNQTYAKIARSDNNRAETTATKGNASQHLFRFKIDINPKAIVEFSVSWEGYKGDNKDAGRFRIWNLKAGWEDIGTPITQSEAEYSATYSGISRLNYITEDGCIYLMAYCKDDSKNNIAKILTDYVEVKVTYVT